MDVKHFLLAVLLLPSNICFGQLLNIPTIGNEIMRESRYSDIEGSPYLFDAWRAGTIFDNAGREYANRSIKYDAYKDQLELNQEGSVLLLNSGLYPKFLISSTKDGTDAIVFRVFKTGYKIEGYNANQYFEVLFEGANVLLRKIKISFIDQTVNSYGTSTRVKRFTTDVKYFIVNSGGKSSEIKLKKSSLIDALGQEGTKATNYIEQNKLKIKSELDVIEVLRNL